MSLPSSFGAATGLPPVGDGTVLLPGGVTVASPVVVRVAGLPMAAMPRLCSGQSFREACAIARLRERLGSEGKAISEELYEVIGARADGGDKAALVGLRRCVFRVRRPGAREWNEHVAGLLPAELAARLRSWTAARDSLDRLGGRLPATLGCETSTGRTALRDVVRDPGFQRALSLSSPTLFAETARWLADGSRVPRRPSLVRLAEYAARAATKTSPYSTFTILGWGTWARRGPDVRLGRLESVVAVTNGAPDEATAIRRARSRLRHPAAVHDVPAHPAARRALSAGVDEITARTGVTTPPGDRFQPWHENAVLTDPIGELSTGAWRPALEDLDVVRRILAVLDPALSLRVALAAYCCERFGPGARVPFLTLHESIARGLAGATSKPGTPVDEILELLRTLGPAPGAGLGESRLPRLREAARLQRDLWRAALVPPDPDGVIRPDVGALERLAASWPHWVGTPRSIACHLQVVRGDGLRLALNAVHGGHRRERSRTLHLIREAGGCLPPDSPGPTAGAGQTVAELGGLFGFSPDVRLPAARYEIDYPFTVSDRAASRRLPLRDLSVVHDPGTGSVSLVAAGRRAPVTAQHLGMTADFLLPPAARLLVQAFGSGYLVFAGLPMFTSRPEPAAAGVHRLPRVEVGRVMVRRAQWIAPADLVPARDNGESDAGYLVRLAGWLLAHDIPARCFVRADAAGPPTGTGNSVRTRKPAYVDFANWYLVRAFERMVGGGAATVTFEEALPGPEDALGLDGGDARATEFVVELIARDGN